MHRSFALVCLSAFLLLAGCGDKPSLPEDPGQAGEPTPAQVPRIAIHPWSFSVVTAAIGAPVSAMESIGEPSVDSAPDGTVFLTFTGCDNGLPYSGVDASATPFGDCPAPVVLRSRDGGGTWQRLNGPDGRLAADAGPGYADTLVRVDGVGRVYVISMGPESLELQRSDDGGDTWWALGNLLTGTGRDRPWLEAVGDGHLALVWRQSSGLVLRTSTDAGVTWSDSQAIAEDQSRDGQIVMDPSGTFLFVPYGSAAVYVPGMGHLPGNQTLRVWRLSLKDGASTDIDTGIALHDAERAGPLHTFALAMDGDGRLGVAWDEAGLVPGGAPSHANVRFSVSSDNGTTWNPPQLLTGRVSFRMPALAGLIQGGFALAAYASDVPGDTERVGIWDLTVTRIDPAASSSQAAMVVADPAAHSGGICSRGTECLPTARDRTLLDLIEATQAPDGRIHVAYTADPAAQGREAQVRAANQDA